MKSLEMSEQGRKQLQQLRDQIRKTEIYLADMKLMEKALSDPDSMDPAELGQAMARMIQGAFGLNEMEAKDDH